MAYISPDAHLDDEILERYALGKLEQEALGPVEEHLLICHECQDRLTETDDYIRILKEALRKFPAEPQ